MSNTLASFKAKYGPGKGKKRKTRQYNDFPVSHRLSELRKKVYIYAERTGKKSLRLSNGNICFASALFQKANRKGNPFYLSDKIFNEEFCISEDICKDSRKKLKEIGLIDYFPGTIGRCTTYALLEVPPEGYIEDLLEGGKCLGCYSSKSPKCEICSISGHCIERCHQVREMHPLLGEVEQGMTKDAARNLTQEIKQDKRLSSNEIAILIERVNRGSKGGKFHPTK
ncbi:MAG: hypothetical protein JW873_02895 [Candidatus Saganbacteria bacterium]|nr:hypothetical protein [Candidatus Saganbacteria bacterium]